MLDALGNGLGFTIALLMMGIPREVLGNGTFLNMLQDNQGLSGMLHDDQGLSGLAGLPRIPGQ